VNIYLLTAGRFTGACPHCHSTNLYTVLLKWATCGKY